MTCLNEVLSVTLARCDSLITAVRFLGDFHYFNIRELGGGREREYGESSLLGRGRADLQVPSYAVHKHRNKEASGVLALNQVGENWR